MAGVMLPHITVPVLLVHGDRSNFYTAATARYLLDRLPDARLVSYEGALGDGSSASVAA